MGIDTNEVTFDFIGNFSRGGRKWSDAFVCPNGRIYCLPCDDNSVLQIDPASDCAEALRVPFLSEEIEDKYVSGVLGVDGRIYAVPCCASHVLIISPLQNGGVSFARINHDFSLSSWKWSCAVAGPNGLIYGIPNDASSVLCILPDTGSRSVRDD